MVQTLHSRFLREGLVVAARRARVPPGLWGRLGPALQRRSPARCGQPEGGQVSSRETQDEHDQDAVLVEHHQELTIEQTWVWGGGSGGSEEGGGREDCSHETCPRRWS